MTVPKINSAHGSDTRNVINRAIETLNRLGTDVQTLVAEGQLTEEQYAELLTLVNGLLKSGDIDRGDLADGLQKELDDFNNFRNATVFSLEAIIRQFNLEQIPDPIYKENLWDSEETELGTLSTSSGNLNPHESNRTSFFIPVEGGENYTITSEPTTLNNQTVTYVEYDANQDYIKGDQIAFGNQKETRTRRHDPDTKYVRVTVPLSGQELFALVIGNEPYSEEIDGTAWDGGFWENVPSPPLKNNSVVGIHIKDRAVTENKLSQDVTRKLNSQQTKALKPYPNKLNFVEISNGFTEVKHLSRDGKVTYFSRGATAEQSMDDGDTFVVIGAPSDTGRSIQAIREVDDGELLISTSRSDSNDERGKIFKTVGYDRNNPENTQFKEVMEAISPRGNITQVWGLETYGNICIASEYGLRGVDGAKYVYLSQDFGETWDVIFNQMTDVDDIEGAPEWTENGHLHTVHYDRYWDRIWLAVGDNPNTSTYYSDDLGETWHHVPGSEVVQYTGIISYPEGVIFGSDRSPNGLHVWYRTDSKEDEVEIETLKTINDETNITHVFQRAFRRYDSKDEPGFFSGTRVSNYDGILSGVIMGFTGIDNPHVLYEFPTDLGGSHTTIGVTAQGHILTSYLNGTNHSIIRAKAPVWE